MTDTNSLILLLKEIDKAAGPVGASTLYHNLLASQATIGRQLVFLENKGYVKKVSNKGRVLTPEGSNFLKSEDINYSKTKLAKELVNLSIDRGDDTLIEIIRIRELLEPYAAAGAAECANERDIYNLENLAFAHRYALSQGLAGNEENLNFHLEIARINNNRTLLITLKLLLTANEAYVEFSKAGEAKHDLQITHHFRILNAIRERDANGARNAMLEHLEHVTKDIEQSHQRR
jgi:GntR family transcriptional regulator, transcriptional repressor for pyruvate dehydrogenase complex